MKLFISSDMEGVTGVTAWEDVVKGSGTYDGFREQMTKEVLAVCETALEKQAKEIFIKDAHSTARNLRGDRFPKGVKLFSGWSKDPLVMMSGLDSTFDAVIFTGYHSGAFNSGNPLSHTMRSESIFYFKINGKPISEFVLNAYTAAYFKVPVIGIVGDELICRQAHEYNPNIVTMPVKKGIGAGTISLSSIDALELIKKGTDKALSMDFSICQLPLPETFKCEICYKDHFHAYRASFYKGVGLVNDFTVEFETDDYFEVLRTFMFI